VSSSSEPALKLFEWCRTPVGTWDKSVFWITNYRWFAKTVLSLKSVPFARVISYPVSAALFCREKFKAAGAAPKASTTEIERSAVCWMLHQCREQGIYILENVGCRLERPGLPSIPAPDNRTLPSSSYYYKASDSDLCETLKDAAVWAPSSFDGDASL